MFRIDEKSKNYETKKQYLENIHSISLSIAIKEIEVYLTKIDQMLNGEFWLNKYSSILLLKSTKSVTC